MFRLVQIYTKENPEELRHICSSQRTFLSEPQRSCAYILNERLFDAEGLLSF